MSALLDQMILRTTSPNRAQWYAVIRPTAVSQIQVLKTVNKG